MFSLVTFQVLALDPSRSLVQYNCQMWRRQNGLPAKGITAITQTRDGYIWLGTSRGLVRFDGTEFKSIAMPKTRGLQGISVTALAPAPGGGVWCGLRRGGYGFYNGKHGWTWGKTSGLESDWTVRGLLESPDGSLWLSTEVQSGRRTRDGRYEVLQSTNGGDYNIVSICQGSGGRIWLGTFGQGLLYWQDGRLVPVPAQELAGANVSAVAEDHQGRIWVGTQGGLYCYGPDFQRQETPPLYQEVRALLVDRHGVVWIGTTGEGLARWKDGAFTFLKADTGLAEDRVTALAEDAEGSLWIGTQDGLSQLSDVKFATFNTTLGVNVKTYLSVCASKAGGFWAATSDSYLHVNETTGACTTNPSPNNAYVKRMLEARNGDLYLVTGTRNIEIVSGGKVVANHLSKDMVVGMVEDDRGVVVSSAGDLYRVGTNYFVPYEFKNGEKPQLNWVLNMVMGRDGCIWIASVNGICRVKDGTFRQWMQSDGLSEGRVSWICQDADGVVWAGLLTGIARLKNDRIRMITQDNGLFDNQINSIVPDDHGFLWVDSGQGIFRVSRQVMNEFADGKVDRVDCQPFDGPESVKSDEKNGQEQSGCKTRNGWVCFPTAQGIVLIDPSNIATNRVPPPVHVNAVRVNGAEMDADDGKVVVEPGKGELEFHYAGLSFITPQKVRYRYRLSGYDKDWVAAETRRSAFYTNLKPGTYRFEVQACNADGVWGASAVGYNVELLPHFYQTTWFVVLAGASGILLLVGVSGWRLRRLRRKQKRLQAANDQLEAKVRERTAELAESNTSLKGEIEERKRAELEVERIHRQLMDASRLAGQAEVASSVLHNVGNVLNSVNVSTTLVSERLQKLRLSNLVKAAELLHEHSADLAAYLTSDERGSRLPEYLQELSQHLRIEQSEMLAEVTSLAQNVEHIKEIVTMQQNYAKVSGTEEKVEAAELMESALKMHASAYARHSVRLVREYDFVPTIIVDRHKVLQILINILQNAKYACDESGNTDKKVIVRIRPAGNDRVTFEIADSGVGILPQNLTRIFSHGFTTRKNGHGFGLHSSALAAKEMGGSLSAHSEGVGRGATFTLELPLAPRRRNSDPLSTASPPLAKAT